MGLQGELLSIKVNAKRGDRIVVQTEKKRREDGLEGGSSPSSSFKAPFPGNEQSQRTTLA